MRVIFLYTYLLKYISYTYIQKKIEYKYMKYYIYIYIIVTSIMNSFTTLLLNNKSPKEHNGARNRVYTHTQIGCKEMNIFGGIYNITTDIMPTFWKQYYNYVFEQDNLAYLTERQLPEGGPLLIDLDFRFDYSVDTRQYNNDHITDIIYVYLESIKSLFNIDENTCKFPVYVMEKPNINRVQKDNITKDGIHLIFGIQMNHNIQLLLRKRVLEEINGICDIPVTNSWENVLDEGISTGTTNWQVYGSRKPGYTAYKLTKIYNVSFDNRDKEFIVIPENIENFSIKENIHKLSARYDKYIKLTVNSTVEKMFLSNATEINNRVACNSNSNPNPVPSFNIQAVYNPSNLATITNYEKLKTIVDAMISSFTLHENYLTEIHNYTQILPEKFYEPGSHLMNRRVGFALKHTDDRLFLSWIMLRSKASDFDYNTISDLYEQWTRYFKERIGGVTGRSIIYWAQQYNNEEYLKVKETTISNYVDASLEDYTEYDSAMVLYQMFKDKFICSSIKHQTWYVFRKHHWMLLAEDADLRNKISVDLHNLYQSVLIRTVENMNQFDANSIDYDKLKQKSRKIADICLKTKRTNDKRNIMREAAEIFYDPEFKFHMDENKYLMCFTNGVVDIKNKEFRQGYPHDYITKSTNIPYIEHLESVPGADECKHEIIQFMKQLFPVENINKYMWEHLASTLIGENINQTFNIYRGNGSNGKSLLTDLMASAYGEYAGTCPVTLLTDKRVTIGGTSSEVMQLKGVRYAIMQEPSKDAKINEGMMKQLTGDAKLQARALYSESETFDIQFHIVVCVNTLFEVVSNDNGTWRRICIVEFMSKFVNPDDPFIDDTPYQYPKDPILKEKLTKWAPILMHMLMAIAFKSQGIVQTCDEVKSATNKYRQSQDHISAFVNEMVVSDIGGKVTKNELNELFRKWFADNQGTGKRPPKGVELHEFMNTRFGKYKSGGWNNIKLVYDEEEDDDNEEEIIYKK